MIPVKATGRKGTLVKDTQAPPAERVSNFLITMNTNVRYTSSGQATTIGNDLVDAADQLFTSDNVKKILIFRSNPDEPDFSLIDSVDADYQPELGGKKHQIHMHIFLRIRHRVPGKGLHLNIPEIKSLMRQNGTTNAVKNLAYVNVHAFSSEAAIRAYISKGTLGKQLDTEEEVRRKISQGSL